MKTAGKLGKGSTPEESPPSAVESNHVTDAEQSEEEDYDDEHWQLIQLRMLCMWLYH
jgi:hypothetical protein